MIILKVNITKKDDDFINVTLSDEKENETCEEIIAMVTIREQLLKFLSDNDKSKKEERNEEK